ncbi:MAG: spore coat protein CotJB [Clostridia bacterium]|nr:spore coat protein CotJB [Clostridia bacterium]
MNRNETTKHDHTAMNKLRAIDFALQETVLFLDAYPENKQALHYYHQLLAQRRELIEELEHSGHPLTMYGNKSQTSWDWIRGPWPWEPDAN